MPGTHPRVGRPEEVDQLLRAVERWARDRDEILAVALVGSWARGDARPGSDVDLVFVTADVATYAEGTSWLAVFPGAAMVRTRTWGPVTERRLVLPSGLEVEVGVAKPSWASTDPLDPGTAQVVGDGLRIIHDPKGLLRALAASIGPDRG